MNVQSDNTGTDGTTKAINSNIMINLNHFCTVNVPDFTPLGGSRPDAAVVACVAVWKKEDVILPPDVLDTSLGMLCAPPIIKDVSDLEGREELRAHCAFGRWPATRYSYAEGRPVRPGLGRTRFTNPSSRNQISSPASFVALTPLSFSAVFQLSSIIIIRRSSHSRSMIKK